MKDYEENIGPDAAILATHQRHTTLVREGIQRVLHDLERRALLHDVSKLRPDELSGFAKINATARTCEFGSDAYRESIAAERDTVDRHQRRNSHHPEAHEIVQDMGFLDIIEMVCDWRGAAAAYSDHDHGSAEAAEAFLDSVENVQANRWPWTEAQWWLVVEVAQHLTRDHPDLWNTGRRKRMLTA